MSKQDPKISVLMPVYNSGNFLKEAIDSILNQSFSDFELLLINDGSSDHSEQIIESFSDERIVYIKNERNLGLIETLNKGLKLCKGRYIARMDGDDVSKPERFEKQYNYLETHPDVAVVATKLVIVNSQGAEIDHWKEDLQATTIDEIKNTLPISNCIGHPTVMIRSQVLKEVGYNHRFKHSEDWGLWLYLLSKGHRIAKLDEVLLQYRVHGGSITVSENKKGTETKVLRFKWSYLKYKLFRFNVRGTDIKVFRSFARDLIKFLFLPVLGPLYQVFKIGPVRLLTQYLKVKKQLSVAKDVKLIYVFPFYHTGGAERVHASILEAVDDKNSMTIITRRSEDQVFYNEFAKHSRVVQVDLLLDSVFGKKWLINRLKALSQPNLSLTIFGCNAYFFYELIPLFKEKTRFIDLLHAFVHSHEQGPEKWSLPYVSRLQNRVVISQVTKNDFARLYASHGLEKGLLERILCVPNFVETKPSPVKDFTGKLKVLYAGRGAEEKRIHLIAKAAHLLKEMPVEFHFAGNVEAYIPKPYSNDCVQHGMIRNEHHMQKLYVDSHLVIIASSREGFPMVIMEGMMNGLIPISTAVGGISEHIHHKENGILVTETDEDKIVERFVEHISFCALNLDAVAQLSQNAYHYAMGHFSKENFIHSYQNLLRS